MGNVLELPDRIEFVYGNNEIAVEEEIQVVCPLCGQIATKVFTLPRSTVYIHRYTNTLVECEISVKEERRVMPSFLSSSDVMTNLW